VTLPHQQGPSPEHARSEVSVPCDLCGAAFTLPPELVKQGVIHGLLVCTACVEDELQARAECAA
jgi:formylmethanofuran dehydrogenase subunit E